MDKDDIPALLEEIRSTDIQTLLKGKDKNGTPYLKHIFEIHFKLFGETCSSCPGKITGYINKIKKYNSSEIMKKEEKKSSAFQLNTGVIIPVPGTSTVYSEHNITDEIALELLSKNANRKSMFRVLPADVDEQIKNFLDKPAQDEDDSVTVGDHKISVEEAISLLEKINVSTKATTVKGVENKISGLKTAEAKEFNTLVEGFATHKLSQINTDSVTVGDQNPKVKTIDELQFDLDKATQDYESFETDGPEKEAAKTALDVAQLAFDTASGTN